MKDNNDEIEIAEKALSFDTKYAKNNKHNKFGIFGVMPLKDFAKEINKSVKTVLSWRKNGSMPGICFKTIGGSVFIKIEETQKWLLES